MAQKYIAKNRKRLYIREWIADRRLTQKEVADKMETDPANLNKWIKEPWRVTGDVLSDLSVALNLESPGLLYYSPNAARAMTDFRAAAQEFARRFPDSDGAPAEPSDHVVESKPALPRRRRVH